MSSLKERIELLEVDLKAVPQWISICHDLPFAIMGYDPNGEWPRRREARLLATRLQEAGREVHTISMAERFWEAIAKSEGLEAVVELERDRGYLEAQEQVATSLSDRDWCPLAELLAKRLEKHDPEKSNAFLTRVATMATGIYHMSKLRDQMQGETRVTTIIFYPGSIEGTTGLRFMDLKDREASDNYRVKIYG